MGRKSIRSSEEKLQVVLAVMRGEMTQVEIARRMELSQTTISKWLKQFTEGGREALARGENPRAPASKREVELEQHIEELKRKAVAPSVPNNSVSPQAGKR